MPSRVDWKPLASKPAICIAVLATPPAVVPVTVTPEKVASPSNSNSTMSPEPFEPLVPLPSKDELVTITAWTPAWAKPPPALPLVSVRPET